MTTPSNAGFGKVTKQLILNQLEEHWALWLG